MPTRFLVRFAAKEAGTPTQERISAIGGRDPHGKPWRLTSEEAVAGIESGEWKFFVRSGRAEEEVVVAVTAEGRKSLDPAMLMALPPFPA